MLIYQITLGTRYMCKSTSVLMNSIENLLILRDTTVELRNMNM